MNTTAAFNMAPNEEDYRAFLSTVHDNFISKAKGVKLFNTNASELFEMFIRNLPSDKQHYTCHACRRFIENFGSIVAIDENGKTVPMMWDVNTAPPFFVESVRAIETAVSNAKVTGVFYCKDKVWGQPTTGEWRHMAVEPPPEHVFNSRLQTPYQAEAEKREDFKNMIRVLNDFPVDAIAQALSLLRNNNLYRSEKCLGVAEWLKGLHDTIDANKKMKTNLLWRAVALSPTGFCHPRSSMIGTLLEDIIAGLPFDTIEQRFADKMRPLQYQRPQADPSAGNIAEAEKMVEKLGIANSLSRRFAKIEEIESLWTPKILPATEEKGGVFSHLDAKNRKNITPVDGPAKPITWDKFSKTILPDAEFIEFLVPHGNTSFGAYVTADDFDAPPILQWDHEGNRNPVSHYLYNNGSSADNWQLQAGEYAKVSAVSLQPSNWGGSPSEHQGNGVMFVIDGCKDKRTATACLFPEILKAELRSIRATIEAYSNNAKMGGQENASACGIILQESSTKWDSVFRVTTGDVQAKFKIDRWD